MSKKPITDLFADLECVAADRVLPKDGEPHDGTWEVWFESRTSPDTLGIKISIPYEVWDKYDFGPHGPNPAKSSN